MDYGERPLIVFWETTKACALACKHCRARAQRRQAPGELTTEEAVALVDEVASWGPPFPRLVLTGGDPLERADLFEIVEAAHARGLAVALAPAATDKLDRKMLEALAHAGAWGIAVSLDAAEEKAHDAFRRAPGSFQIGVRAIREAREAGLVAQVNSVVHRENLEDLARLFLLVHSLGASAWEVIPLISVGRAKTFPALSADETEDVLHFLEDAAGYGIRVHAAETPASRRVALLRRAGRASRPTSEWYVRARATLVAALGEPREASGPLGTTRSGAGVAFVSAMGEVMPSGFLPVIAGNVRKERLSTIYRESPLFRRLRDPSSFTGPCGACSFRDACGGSRARAYAATGDPFASDPSCPRVATPPRAT